MSETSDGRGASDSQRQAAELQWKCIHCSDVLSGVPPGTLPHCPFCRKSQTKEEPVELEAAYCVNPNCQTKFFTPSTKICHQCRTHQDEFQKTGGQSKPTIGTGTPENVPSSKAEQHSAEVKQACDLTGAETDRTSETAGHGKGDSKEVFHDASSALPQQTLEQSGPGEQSSTLQAQPAAGPLSIPGPPLANPQQRLPPQSRYVASEQRRQPQLSHKVFGMQNTTTQVSGSDQQPHGGPSPSSGQIKADLPPLQANVVPATPLTDPCSPRPSTKEPGHPASAHASRPNGTSMPSEDISQRGTNYEQGATSQQQGQPKQPQQQGHTSAARKNQREEAYKKLNFEDQLQLYEGKGSGRGGGRGRGAHQSSATRPGADRQNRKSPAVTELSKASCPTLQVQVADFKDSEACKRKTGAIDEVDVTGLNKSPGESVSVTFHVLVPMVVWNWNTQYSRMHIHFGHLRLGKWKRDVGDFKIERTVGDGLCEMSCTFQIDASILKGRCLPYKYRVYTVSKQGYTEEPYEFLHGVASRGGGKPVNRCLVIPAHMFQQGGHYHQYDNMVYPERKAKAVYTKAWETVKGWFQQSNKQDELFVPDHESMQKKCLYVYLENYQQLLRTCAFTHEFRVSTAAEEMYGIFRQLHFPHIHHTRCEPWIAFNLIQEMKNWLFRIIEVLQSRPVNSPEENGRRIAAVITVICCLDKMIPYQLKLNGIEPDCIAAMMDMLRLKPDDIDNQKCTDYDYVCSLLKPASHKAVGEAIRSFCSQLLHKRDLQRVEWLYAVPLIHFLKGDSQPFQKPELAPEKMQWGDKSLGLDQVKSRTYDNHSGFVEQHLEEVKPLIALDPLFLQVFVYVCPKKDLLLLMKRIPPHVSATWISVIVQKSRDLNKNELEDIHHLLTEIVKLVQERTKGGQSVQVQLLDSTVRASLLLFTRLKQKIMKTDAHSLNVVKVSLTLVLCSVKQLRDCTSTSPDISTVTTKEAMGHLYQSTKEWVEGGHRGPSFGCPSLQNAKEEMVFWESLITLDCPPDVLGEWHSILQTIVKERVSKISFSGEKIDLFCKLESRRETHSILTNIFMEAAIQSLEGMMSEGTALEKIYQSAADKKRVGRLLGDLLHKRYPQGAKMISFDELLNWGSWPSFLKIYTSESLIAAEGAHETASCLPEECQILCTCARSKLDEVCDQISTGSITLKELHKISAKTEQMEHLCMAAATTNGGTSDFSTVKNAVGQRMSEYKAFTNRKERLQFLCSHISPTIQGIDHVRQQLQADYNTRNINALCFSDSKGNFTFPCFKSAGSLHQIVDNFYKMAHTDQSLFQQLWEDKMRATRTDPDLQIGDVVTKVWEPVFGECQVILDQLQGRTIQLSSVDKLFKRWQNQPRKLKMHLLSLFEQVNMCLGQHCLSNTWIDGVVYTMRHYWSLCQYSTTAATFLELKEKLKLKGNFDLVERLATQVSKSVRNQALETVDQSLIDTGTFLQTASDPTKLQCLQTFARCLDVVEWIRMETKNVSDLQNFVNVALATAAGGEGDLENDKLSNLRMVGSGFGSLIYNLTEDAGFETLAEGCKSMWQALEHTPSLPKLLEDCNRELDWYKAVKETQGSVEYTSFGQMDNINKYGIYRVGCSRPQSFQSIHEVIQLSLEEKDKRLHKKSYNLNELRDLESKLVLITGSKAENRKQVDQFLNTLHSVCRIADALIALQQAGYVMYMGWSLRISCAVDDPLDMVAELQRLAKDMEDKLQCWKEEVKQTRQKIYELNYYTTLQLMSLREELGKMKDPAHLDFPISKHVLALFQSISTEVTARDVQDVVYNVLHDQTHNLSTTQTAPQNIMESTPRVVECNQPMDSLVAADNQAPAPTVDSMSAAPKPKLTVQSLSEKQKEIFIGITDYFGYPSQLVLLALEQFGEDKYEVENWCRDNSDQFEFSESEDEVEDSEGEVSSYESESEIQLHPITSTPEKEVTGASPAGSSLHATRSRIQITHMQPIDEHHPVIEKLVDAGYNLEMSIEAMKMHDNAEECLDYLLSQGEGEVFQSSTTAKYVSTITEGNQKDSVELSIHCDQEAEKRYLSLLELGRVLQELNRILPATVSEQRTFFEILKVGSPNLIVTASENVLKTTLALYMKDESLPLPTHEEVLICNLNTTAEEVSLLWQRAVGDPNFKRIFCLVHAEKLSYQACDKALRSLSKLIQGKTGYRLVIICSSEDENRSRVISKLSTFRRPYEVLQTPSKYQEYLKNHFTGGTPAYTHSLELNTGVLASVVDHESSCVRVVCSTRSGMGKSLYIQRMAEQLKQLKPIGSVHITIPIHGPSVTPDVVLEFLKQHMGNCAGTILHFDIAPGVLTEVDTILFCLLILRSLSDSHGRVWRCHPSQLYAIEVTVPEQQREQEIPESCTLALLNLLPSVECSSPREAMELMRKGMEVPSKVLMDAKGFESVTYQRVYQYLRRHIGQHDLDQFTYIENVEGSPADCLTAILRSCGIKDPSWAEIQHFVKFLDIQLQSCEDSVFCNTDLVGDVMAGLKGFVVKFMIRMSQDFATSSLHGEVAMENEEEIGGDDLEQYQIDKRREWEQSSHPYIFFNQDRASITFVGFRVTKDGNLIDPKRGGVLEAAVMTPQLYTGLRQNKVDFDENYQAWGKDVMITKIATVMGLEYLYDPDPSYVLTIDNLIKMLAIQMRFRCGIPVVIMGETGCGKTRLIRYMCDLAAEGSGKNNMFILKVHGGITEADITSFVKKAEAEAAENRQHGLDTVLFFDEANTTDAIGLIKEIMCDHRLHGRPISDDLRFIAACNPYRKHTDDMIQKLESAGLGFYVKATETQQKLGKIPLRQLVYRVLELPPSMRPLVYDFGQLNIETEQDYTSQIVKDHVRKHPGLSQQNAAIIPSIARVLAWSQRYMRGREDECSFVSLRDVERAMIVLEYFFEKMSVFGPLMDEKARQELQAEDEEPLQALPAPSSDSVTRSLLLSLSVCYHARLQDREEYEKQVAQEIMVPLALPGGAQQFRDEIRWCQEVLLDNMTLGPNIARNAALRENIFMMAICIDLRIPLFLVGKPGSSKSLAKAIVADSLQGQASTSDLLKGFKQVHMFSYQCSQLSTPESVIEIFNTAKRFQKKEDTTKYVSVVVLDEVGLAEDSPNLPLKALHPLLEDGTEGADESQQIIEREKRVAFIGISNWALDPAKMNRGVMVTRGDPDVDELELSARGICSYKQNDPVKERLEPLFKPLAEAYKGVCRKQKWEFFGLRDFYSLIKMLYWMCKKSNMPLTWPQLEHAIQRNFGGLESEELDPLEEFEKEIPTRNLPDLTHIPEKLHPIVNPDCSRLGLIKTSLRTKETTWHGENRYLLFLTENYAALEILRHYLHDVVRMSPTGSSEVTTAKEVEPFILFGSSFPKDKEYTQVCRNINKIKICMETGRTVILLNLESLYESLYDVLNQYYIYHGGNRYVDLGLQTHRVKCRVHDNFKLILIAEKSTVYEKFPTPLINRLEKHFVLTESVLTEWQLEVLEHFQDWIQQFSHVNQSSGRGHKFTEGDAFIGYQKDTPAAVIFQATNQLEKLGNEDPESLRMWEKIIQADVLGPSNLIHEDKGSELWKKAVLKLSQYLLLQTASVDAVVRLKATPLQEHHDELWRIYSKIQCHSSLDKFLYHQLREDDHEGGLLIQVTTHSHLLSPEELEELGAALGWDRSHILFFLLQEFDTELDFSNKVSPAFQKELWDTRDSLLIIQCDSGHIDGDLVAFARYRIYDERAKCMIQERGKKRRGDTHILFIIHLPKQAAGSSFVGFQGDPWISTHIDDLRPAHDSTLTLQHAMGAPISEIFFGGDSRETQTLLHSNLDNQSETYKDEEESMHVEDVEEEQTGEGMEVEYDDMPPLEGSEDELSSLEGGEDEEMAELPPQIPTGAKEEDESEEGVMPESMLPEQPIEQVLPSVEELPNEGEQMQARAPIQRMHGYYWRLNSCIQAAASRLQDSEKNKERATQRVAILVGLIPRDPPIPLDPSTFYGVLVHHIHKLLKERGEVREDDKHWVLNEALNAKKLQNGGTFRNVLARKLDDVIIPIFAEIIGIVDRNYNLNLIAARNENTPMLQFWLAIFRNPDVLKLRYEDMIAREQVPGMGGRMAEEDFKCQLPFSWVIKEAVDSQWDHAKSSTGDKEKLFIQLCFLVSDITPIGEVLRNSVTEDQCQEFYKCYLHDFVRSVHKCTHKQSKNADMEFKLIADALDGLTHATEFASIDGHESLVNKIAALHVVYQFNREQVLWFGQLISHMPGLLVPLEGNVPTDKDEMVLHLHAAEKALERLNPCLDRDEATLSAWLNDFRLSQNVIDSILSLPSQHGMLNKARLQWQLIRALQMFVEHVVMKHEGMVPFARRIPLHLQNDPDFLKASSVEKVKQMLNGMDGQLMKKMQRSQPKKLESIRRSCRAFFMELVSTLCFRGQATPEPDLIKMLVDTVFTETREAELVTKDFSPYKEEKSDKIPVVRSFLLQLLLEHSSDQVRIHLGEYFERSCQVYGGGVDQNLCLLCIQCFEDALFKEHSVKSFLERITGTLVILQDGHQALQNQADFAQGEHSLEYLEGVAKVRFALSVVAELLHMQVTEVGIAPGHGAHHHGAQAIQLVQTARDVCNDPHINAIDTTGTADTMGPVVYLLKLLVRQYGFPTLKKVSETHAWVVPPELKRNEEENVVDPFVIYGDTYKRLRECLSEAIFGKQFEALAKETEELTHLDAVYLLLALFEKATLSRASILPARQLLPDVLVKLDEFIQGCKILSRELQWTARALLSNQQGGNLAQLTVSPEQDLHHRTLGAIVVHTAIVFFCRQRVDVLKPFSNMLNNPVVLESAYLPTMPEDALPEVQRVLSTEGAFYECPRGHPYYISECGKPMQTYTCNTCGARIGGTDHQLTPHNKEARRTDNTQAGHCLGTPEGRSTVPISERGLSPAACCIVRALMHAALIWASCNNETAVEGLVNMVKAGIPYPQLPEFFWRHLEKDIQLLSRAINRNEDECTILLHLILRQIFTQNPPTSDVVRTVSTLGARNAREEWEKIFNRHYIQPTLEALTQELDEAMHSILNDDDQEHDQLFCLVYEQVQVTEGSLKPHFWTFRSRITLEHLSLTLHQKNMKKQCHILYEFLKEEPNLRATQYLPDIVRLQQCMYDSFHHRLDRKEAKKITIGEFLKSRKSENFHQQMFESLQRAWSLVGDKLRDHARLRVEEQYLRPAITVDESLEYLIPTTTGAGACTTALVDFLVLTHNSFIEKCRGIVREQTKGKFPWKEHKVAITHIHRCHLLDYEQQLLSIVLSHCHYSLTLGKGQDVSYDLPALEKHVLDRFIHGKPLILSDIPQVVYRKDIYTAATFAAVRKKVAPQTALPPRVQQEILMELRTADRLRDTLDVVEIVLGFLSTGGGRAERSLTEYIKHALKMKRLLYEKVRDYCTLGHIMSLWETLSVELARKLTLSGQEPFDSLRMELLEDLKTDDQEDQKAVLYHSLRSFNLDQLLGVLYEFIETYVKHSPDNEKDWPLIDTLEAFLQSNGLPTSQFQQSEFPESITLAQAATVWKHIVQYQEKQRH